MRGLSIFFLFALAASAGAEPIDDALAALRAGDARVAAVAWRLTTANTDLCPAKGPQSGLVLHDALGYGPETRAAAVRDFHLIGAPAVLAVVKGSPADAAGLQPDDALLAVNGTNLEAPLPSLSAPAGAAQIETARRVLDTALSQGPATLSVARGGERREVRLSAVAGCAYQVQLLPSSERRGSSDGVRVSVTTALARYAERDEDLAVIIGHEMAHNLLRHQAERTGSSRSRERAADYVGLYLAARAGYDISGASEFWRRFGADDWRARFGILTHPSPTARSRALAAAAAEIARKQATGEPLVPDLGR